jgi:hypothetical protein
MGIIFRHATKGVQSDVLPLLVPWEIADRSKLGVKNRLFMIFSTSFLPTQAVEHERRPALVQPA